MFKIYNDAYRPILGSKHPAAMGAKAQHVWPEIWHIVGPRFHSVLSYGGSTWSENELLLVKRYGHIEECYFTLSYSPIIDETCGVAGVFCAVTETTEQVISERRLLTLQRLSRELSSITSFQEILAHAPAVLAQNNKDFPFVRVYDLEDSTAFDRLIYDFSPAKSVSSYQGKVAEAFKTVSTSHNFSVIDIDTSTMLQYGFWQVPASRAIVFGIFPGRSEVCKAIIVCGLNPHQPYFNNDLDFYKSLKEQIELNLTVVESFHFERQKTAKSIELRQRLERVFRQAPVGIIILRGENFIVDLVNTGICELFGTIPEHLTGFPVFEILPEIREQGFEELLENVRTTGEPFLGIEIPIASAKQGHQETMYLNFVYEPLYEEDDTISGVIGVAIDVTQQVTTRKQLELSEQRLELAIESSDLGVWELDFQPEVLHCSLKFDEIFGYEKKYSWTVQELFNHIHKEDFVIFKQGFQDAPVIGRLDLQARIIRPDGITRWVHIQGKSIEGEIGSARMIGTIMDITSRKELERQKDEFISIASHELKTPLTSAKAYMQILERRKGTDATTLSFVKKALQQLERLQRLNGDLLDVSKINTGKLPYNVTEFDFYTLLHESIDNVQPTVTSHQILIEESVHVQVQGDYHRLEQVINNFVLNAVKYSPQADTVIVRSVINGHNIVTSVQDFGIGIAPENINKLFERFYRIEDTAMRFQGLGLGLFIASEILQRHGGRFWIESVLGRGSTFYFMLPLPGHGQQSEHIDTSTQFINSNIEILLNPSQHWIHANWIGFQNLGTIQFGCYKIRDFLKRHRCRKMINDNTCVLGTWSDAAEWVGQQAFPMLEREGLVYLAWIYSKSTFSQLSAEKSHNAKLGNVEIKFFDNIPEAEEWLQSKE